MKTKIFTAAIIAILLLLNINVFAAEYEVRDLGAWEPKDINNNGQIVGSENSKPVFWNNGIKTIISDLEGVAYAINEIGQVAGTIGLNTSDEEDGQKAFQWESGTLTFLDLSPGDSYAADINDNGWILGGNNYEIGFWVNKYSPFQMVWPGSAEDRYYAVAINNLGDILGSVVHRTYNSFTFGPVVWGQDLPSIDNYSLLHINDNKQIVSTRRIYDSNGFVEFDGVANNNSNIVVGSKEGHAAIYKDGIIENLNDLIPSNSGWILDSARAINDLGQIVCYGTLNGTNKVCLLTPVSKYELSDPGTEFPVNYENYGIFSDQGTGTYNYEITNPVGLAAAVGEGIYPNSESVLLDARYQEYLSSGKLDGDVWNFVNSDDPWADFFKWATAVDVQPGEKLFYTALALENAGKFQQAVKVYKALIVHFPYTQSYNSFENIYWYPGIAAIDAITRLTRDNPELGYELVNANITIENGYDSNPDDDIFTANAGEFTEYTLQDRINRSAERLKSADAEIRGDGRVQVVKKTDDSWELRVDGNTFRLKGMAYSPIILNTWYVEFQQIEWQWMDTNDNGLIDSPEEAWVDTNGNNLQDADEPNVGDFQLLKDMGCNAIRLYQYAGGYTMTYNPEEWNKELLRKMYEQYGIMVMMGDFLGAHYTAGGNMYLYDIDYTDPDQRDKIKEVVRQMVLDHKNEPYVLMWVLGYENNMNTKYNGIRTRKTNAAEEPVVYADFLNELAAMIHEIDPDHPVAVGNQKLGLLECYAEHAPELDVICTNNYNDKNGVGVSYLREAKSKIDRPLIISEYGADAYHQGVGVNESEQKQHHLGNWKEIVYNSASVPGEGNLLGGIVFEWLDEWWKAQNEPSDAPWIQEITSQFYWGIMPDHYAHEEWFGICSQGDGSQSPFLRQTRSAYDLYKQMWAANAIFDQETGFVTLSWDGYPGLSYTLECSEDNINWSTVSSDIKASLYGRTVWIDNGTQTGGLPSTFRRYYRVSINGASSDVYVLNVFSGYNHVPVANDQAIELDTNESKAFTLTVSDDDNDSLNYNILTQPEHGSLSGTAPDLIYTPDLDYFGIDQFSYKVSDGIDTSEIANVNIAILSKQAATAEFIQTDIITQGNWIGQYGRDGYNIIGDTVNYPNYAQVSNSGSEQWVWNSATTDIRALEKVTDTDRIASCWYGSTSFDINVDITDGQSHQFAVYCLNWDESFRIQKIEVLDAVSQTVLDTQAIGGDWGFYGLLNGMYLVWDISGSVTFRITSTGGDNAVISGLFFGGSSTGIAPSITAQPEAVTVTEGQSATFNVTATGTDPMTYQWYKNDALIDGATTASYTTQVTVLDDNGALFKVTVTNDYGNVTSNEAVLTVNQQNNTTAVFVNKDTTTQGNWKGSYGLDGYYIEGYGANYPSYLDLDFSGHSNWVWEYSTSDIRALEKVFSDDRAAGCCYSSSSFGIYLEVTDGQTHQVAIYCLDWETTSRRQKIEILDAANGTVLDTQEITDSFNGGIYLVWNISGSVIIRATRTSGDNAVISGLFFGGGSTGIEPSIITEPEDITIAEGSQAAFSVVTSGSAPLIYQWYKDDVLIDGATQASYITSETVLADSGGLFKVTVTNDYGSVISREALLTVKQSVNATAEFIEKDTSTRGDWIGIYGEDGYNVIGLGSNYPEFAQVNTSAREYIYIYGPDDPIWEDVSLLQRPDGRGRFASCWFEDGYFDIDVNIIDGQTHEFSVYCLDWHSDLGRSQTVEVFDAQSGALLDTQELNEFSSGTYLSWNISGSVRFRIKQTGADNAVITGIFFGRSGSAGIAPSITAQPEAVTVTEGQSAIFNVTANGTDPMTYQWYKDDVIIDGAIADSYTISSAALIDDGASFKVTITNDYGTITSNAAVLNVNQVSNAEAVFVNTDIATQGNWIGQYGSDGYNVIGNDISYPSYAQVSTSNSAQWVWNSSTTDASALEKASGSDRIAGCWYGSPSHDIQVNITDGQTHQVAIYCLDWESSVRRQTVEVLDAVTGAVLDTQQLNDAFTDGVYLAWNISGSVIIRVTQTWLDNAVISGLFFD
ncbi:MAG: immunoglobulin domain-containing protein [Candidatus Omnitrophica bacterium]|nr:immunoglobulin domain-containing protein [Candidatus Omnitrophota bacterium]